MIEADRARILLFTSRGASGTIGTTPTGSETPMRFLLLALTLMSVPSALAAEHGLDEAIVSIAKATGVSYQFGSRCGVDPGLLRRHKAKFEVEANTANATLPAGQAVDVNGEFQAGVDEGNRFYDSVDDASHRAMLCQQFTVQITQMVSYPGVLTLPTRGMPPR